jgi:hypothetical protein
VGLFAQLTLFLTTLPALTSALVVLTVLMGGASIVLLSLAVFDLTRYL